MANLHEECKKWIISIQKFDFDNVVEGIQNLKNIKQNADSNKALFKFLLHLSHSADQCYRQKRSKEIEIFKIASITCEHLTNVPDKNKLFSAIYYILFYILNKQLFQEAKIIASYLLPGRILDTDDLYESSKYHQIGTLWYAELLKKLDLQVANSKISKDSINEDLITYLQFHLQILKYCDESSRYIYITFDSYMKKFANFPLDIASPYILELFKFMSNHISNLKKSSVIEAYHTVIPVVGIIFYKRTDALNNQKILNCFRECDSHFLESLRTSSESYNCYKFFREYSLNIFETNFMSNEIGESRFNKSLEILKRLIENYGINNDSLVHTVTAIACSFDTLFVKWENLVSEELKNTTITYEDILKVGNLVKRAHGLLKNREFPSNYSCKKCTDPTKCLMKKDIYNAAVATSSYLRLISKIKTNNLDKNIFGIAKELIKELIKVHQELKRMGCKYSASAWDICGRTIFNVGLISEDKYPAEFEELYELLCKEIVQHDGLSSKFSSFGLESPVGTTLQRLCNVNFNQENYRKAMSYTAYNALLSTSENRKKKAYDMWCTIKVKCKDSKEIQELTMLECLKNDMYVVRNIGISVNLEDYDLNDLCLRELRFLFQGRANLILSMKNTLAELDAAKSTLNYARGVLLLCFNALQLAKREYILEHISKAISALKSIKPRTPGIQCLLANLSFFTILEKLYARRQAISKQMDDANFTVKAFKTLRGKRLDDETEDQDEIVPTYGGIDIEEDTRCAKELRDVFTIWESCLEKHLAIILKDWEPEYTLETIVLCGEYSRLYKFNNVEEKCWQIAHKLATALNNFTTCIYVTSRSISLRSMNDTWIKDAKNYVEKIKNSSKPAETDVVALFWLSLADFYLDCKKTEEARVLLDKVKLMPNYKLLDNCKIYIYSSEIQFRNYFILNTEASQQDYYRLLVEIHYMLINLHDYLALEVCKFSNIRFNLFALEQMFETMCNITIPMYSLLSYREMYAHLIYGMQFAQKSGMTMRIAQFLKYSCYIFLLRTQTEEVEARLQDLEHILCLEQFQASMKSNFQPGKNVAQMSSACQVRDAGALLPKNSGASPELKKKMFTTPEFLDHTADCQCIRCSQLCYQYLTFACAYIRGQLYSMLNYTREAEQHFHGACLIKTRLEERDTSAMRKYNSYTWKRHQSYEIDALLYMLDFSMYISDFMPERKDEAVSVIEEAIDDARRNGLDKHPVMIYATELYMQHYVYEAFADKLCIASPAEIPITITNQSATGCITPKQQIERPTRNQRRRKSPPPVAIPVITISDSPVTTQEPVVNATAKPKVAKRTSARNVRRKILVDEIDEIPKDENVQPAPVRKRSTRLASKSNG